MNEPEWTRTYLGKRDGVDTWTCATPPCWLLIEDMIHPERDPWTVYWDGYRYPVNCTTYRVIGYYKTPLPPKLRHSAAPLPPEKSPK